MEPAVAPGAPVGLAESDLRRAADEQGAVLGVDVLGGGLRELLVRLPRLAASARPGEFAQLRRAGDATPLLRRPMSVAFADGEICSFVFEPVGEGTRRLAAMAPGDRLDVLGPLGVGFSTPPGARRVVCVGGGLGCAPFPLAARRAVEAGVEEVVVLSGAATARRLYPAARLRRGLGAVRVVEATDDGTRGRRGPVTELVREAIEAGCDALWACGPNPMLASLAGALLVTGDRPPVAEVCLEAPMGCGFGTCLGCALPVVAAAGTPGPAWALCCRQGPVMPVAAVDWAALGGLPPAHVA